jgi:chorismate-pyruvate lyase
VEAAFLEPVRLVKINVETAPSAEGVPELELAPGSLVMCRQILLQGAVKTVNHVYAESLIALDSLPGGMRDALLQTDEPLGRLWVQHKLETRKEMLRVWRVPAGEEPPYFSGGQGCLARRYRVFSAGRPIMLISEFFPVAAVPVVAD